jgi:hypothetical protein
MFSFTGGMMSYQEMYGPDFVNALKLDRMSLFSADLLRSGYPSTALVLWLSIKKDLLKTQRYSIVGF